MMCRVRARYFMAFGFVVLAITLIVIRVTQPNKCGNGPSDWSVALTAVASTAALVVASLAAVKTRSRWGSMGCAALVAVGAGGVILLYLYFDAIEPCLA
jgi:hypothetical protein